MFISESQIRKIIRACLLSEITTGEKFRVNFSNKTRSVDTSSAQQDIDGSNVDLDASMNNVSNTLPSGDKIQWGDDGNAQARKSAWLILKPFLPSGAVLTSAFRGQDSQDRIIRKYAKEKGYKGNENDLDAMHRFITKVKKMVVARRVGRGHGGKDKTGAFDISGANLNDIWKAVQFVNDNLSDYVKFAELNQGKGKSSIIERKNNAVHVHFNIDDVKMKNFDESKIKERIASLKGSGSKSDSKEASA